MVVAMHRVEGAPLPKDVAPTPDMVDAVILAARSLHKLHITHGDLAPRNIIVQGGLPVRFLQTIL
jgi:tRNA A-37 threonylcarbamoyl transferase component Bud32